MVGEGTAATAGLDESARSRARPVQPGRDTAIVIPPSRRNVTWPHNGLGRCNWIRALVRFWRVEEAAFAHFPSSYHDPRSYFLYVPGLN